MSAEITVEEIKEIRKRYGLSQQAFARILGIGEASMVRYEKGQPPSKANANLIRAARFPEFMADCLSRDGAVLSPSQRESVEKVIYAEVKFDEKGDVMSITDTYMLTLEQEILNEKAAGILADVNRLLRAAEQSGDVAGQLIYSDLLMLIADAKAKIVDGAYDSVKGFAEIRGRIEGLEALAFRANRRAA